MKKKKSEFQILREINDVREELAKAREGGVKVGRVGYTELIQKLTQLKHELRVVRTKSATGEEAESVREYWANMTKAERKKQAEQKKADERAVKKAKAELKKDKGLAKEMASELSVSELQALLDAKSKKVASKKKKAPKSKKSVNKVTKKNDNKNK